MQKLSVVISAFNEEEKIEKCLKSVKWADEIIFIDNNSSDKTSEIAKKYTAKIYFQQNDPLKIDLQKNTGFDKATGEFILSVDADEIVTKELKNEIQKLLKGRDQKSGYSIPRKNIIFGKWIQHSLWWPDYQLRLFKKGKGRFETATVHQPITIDGETGQLNEPLIHENYQTISQYLYKMDKIYTEVEASKLIESGKEISWMDAIRFPANDFLKTFFLQKGYKDGLHGLVLSILQAFYMEVVFAKVWEKQGFKEANSPSFLKDAINELNIVRKDINYWIRSSFIEEEKNLLKKTTHRIIRRLKR